MADFMSMFSGMGGSVISVLWGVLYIIPIIGVASLVIMHLRNRKLYRYNVRIYRIRENGKVKEVNFKGGYIGRKNSAPFFRIKTGRWWWQQMDLTTTPIVKHMDEEDRVYYLQIDVDSLVQMSRSIENLDTGIFDKVRKKIKDFKDNKSDTDKDKLMVQIRKEIDLKNVSTKFTPIESDIKYGAILSVQRIKDILRTEPTWKRVLPYVGLILVFLLAVISYALLLDRCG